MRTAPLLFASEIKAFLDHPSFEKRFNAAQLPLYLSCQYSPGRDTFFAGVEKLLPGHFLEFSDGIVRTARWVQPLFLPGEASISPAEIEAVLRGSVEAHKIADVEVAGFLSGGVDSGLITALARPARSYTIRYAEPRYDESLPARALARSLGLRNHLRCISPGEFWDAVPAVQYHMDEPLADAAAVALYFLNREAARDVKVVLSGEGADELFGGYNIYRDPFTMQWYDRLPLWLRGALGTAASLVPPGPGINFLMRRGVSLEERYFGPTAPAERVGEAPPAGGLCRGRQPAVPDRGPLGYDRGAGPGEPDAADRFEPLAGRGHSAEGRQDEYGPRRGAAGAVS